MFYIVFTARGYSWRITLQTFWKLFFCQSTLYNKTTSHSSTFTNTIGTWLWLMWLHCLKVGFVTSLYTQNFQFEWLWCWKAAHHWDEMQFLVDIIRSHCHHRLRAGDWFIYRKQVRGCLCLVTVKSVRAWLCNQRSKNEAPCCMFISLFPAYVWRSKSHKKAEQPHRGGHGCQKKTPMILLWFYYLSGALNKLLWTGLGEAGLD